MYQFSVSQEKNKNRTKTGFGEAMSKLPTFVWILNHVLRSITWSLFIVHDVLFHYRVVKFEIHPASNSLLSYKAYFILDISIVKVCLSDILSSEPFYMTPYRAS